MQKTEEHNSSSILLGVVVIVLGLLATNVIPKSVASSPYKLSISTLTPGSPSMVTTRNKFKGRG